MSHILRITGIDMEMEVFRVLIFSQIYDDATGTMLGSDLLRDRSNNIEKIP